MNLLELFKPVNTFVFDMDGVLTDGTLYIFPDGNQVRRMNIKDGYALQLAIKKGYNVLIISGSYGSGLVQRFYKLGIKDVFFKVENKLELLQHYLVKNNISPDQVLYMGDDIPDREVMMFSGLAVCPADAVPEISQICKYISPIKGGEGCVRDVIEKVMKLHGSWDLDSSIASK